MLFSRRCRGRGGGRHGEETHAEDASSNIGGDEGTCRRGSRRARATRGGQLRRRASGDRALKGPTPHAPSSCQLSFFLSSSPSSSFPLSHSLFLFLSPPSYASSANALPFKFLLASFSTRHFFLFLFSPRPLAFASLILTNYTVLRVFSTFTGFLAWSRPFRPSIPPTIILSSFPFLVADQPPRTVTLGPRRSEPRRRVSRFKLTCVRENVRERRRWRRREKAKEKRKGKGGERACAWFTHDVCDAATALNYDGSIDIVKSRWRSGLQTTMMMMAWVLLPLSPRYL